MTKNLAIKRLKYAVIISGHFGVVEACAAGVIKVIDALETEDAQQQVGDINGAAAHVLGIIAKSLSDRFSAGDLVKEQFAVAESNINEKPVVAYLQYCAAIITIMNANANKMPAGLTDMILGLIKDVTD